jgi:hypothetical protein
MTVTETQNNIQHEDINIAFKIPIRYNEKVQQLNETIVTDLELVNSVDFTEASIYKTVFDPSNETSTEVIKQISKYYTTDIDYLKETQQLTKNIHSEELNTIHNKYNFSDFDINDTVNLWKEIKGETGFCEKYLYIDWAFAKNLNNNSHYLQFMGLYNIISPILSLCLPILVLIIPFFIIKFKNINLGFKEYIEILKTLISNHAIFKIFTQFHEVDNGQKIYLILSSTLYLFSIYQNILVCIRFYSNMQKIHNYLFKFRKYLEYTLSVMDYYSCKCDKLTKYDNFNLVLKQNNCVLVSLHNELSKITPFSLSGINSFTSFSDKPSLYSKCLKFETFLTACEEALFIIRVRITREIDNLMND